MSTDLRPPAASSSRAAAIPVRSVRVAAWASLVAEIVIVITGGAVRLTDSGLGCPTWPQCTPGSYVTTAAMGIHGVVEFSNRMLTFALVVVAIAAAVAVWLRARDRRDLLILAGLQLLSIPAQAVLGGITVLTKLNPWWTGAHFVFSMVLVALMTVFVVRAHSVPGPRERVVPPLFAVGVHIASALAAVVVLLGILTTGSGPHAGDAHSARNGFDPAALQHWHSIPAYALAVVTLALLVAAWRLGHSRGLITALAAVELAQIAVGITQARLGLPPLLVDIHMGLAAALVAVLTATVLSLKRPIST